MSGAYTSQQASNATASVIGLGSALGTQLQQLLICDDIQPGSELSYQLCKTIYSYHPLGAKIADEPINLAQSQNRIIEIPDSPETRVRDAFTDMWDEMQCDSFIAGTCSTSRIYGVGSLIFGAVKGGNVIDPSKPLDYFDLPELDTYFSIMDPLNTSGSLVLNQDPNAPDFQKFKGVAVSGVQYHPSRVVTLLNERPLFIEYTQASFGYVGRSAYQRALFPLKSFIRSMITDDMVVTKAGVLIAKVKQPGSIADAIMGMVTGFKRAILQMAVTENVISIDPAEDIETLNMMNIDGAYGLARKNILENIASAVPMPAILLNSETFAEGFGEGTEDAKHVARFIELFRMKMQPAYAFCDRIIMHKAWSPAFYETIQADFPEIYAEMDYKTAFFKWKNSFTAQWPSLLIEPDSEKAKSEDVKLKAVIAMLEVLMPAMDPENKAILIDWASQNFNDLKLLFTSPLILDMDALAEFAKSAQEAMEQAQQEPPEPKPEDATT